MKAWNVPWLIETHVHSAMPAYFIQSRLPRDRIADVGHRVSHLFMFHRERQQILHCLQSRIKQGCLVTVAEGRDRRLKIRV